MIKDRVLDKKDFLIEYCNTHTMLADNFTKPALQGAQFKKLQRVIMSWDHTSILAISAPNSNEEHVRNKASKPKQKCRSLHMRRHV